MTMQDGSAGPGSAGYVQPIEKAIASYADRVGGGGGGAPPYDSASLAEIYGPRVRELLDLQAAGFTHAVWKWDPAAGENHWHGASGA